MEILSDHLELVENKSIEELKTENASIASNTDNKEEDKKEVVYEEKAGIFTIGDNVSATNGEDETTIILQLPALEALEKWYNINPKALPIK